SGEVEKSLNLARDELKAKEKTLLEKKEAFIAGIQAMLPRHIDQAISGVISRNADLVQKLPSGDLAAMKRALSDEKPKAVEKGVSALRSSDWMWCRSSSTATQRDPFFIGGVSEGGPIWQSLQSYSRDVELILKKYSFMIDIHSSGYTMNPFQVPIPIGYRQTKELNELNKAVGQAGTEYCQAKENVKALEQQLSETKARERYDSA